jgi:hypothetical protein
VESGQISMQPLPLEIGAVLMRHPWARDRASPNPTGTPRAPVNIRYVRLWYADSSREACSSAFPTTQSAVRGKAPGSSKIDARDGFLAN